MPSQLSNHPVTQDPVRYPDERELLDFNLAKQLARQKAQVDLRYSNLGATTLEDLEPSRLSQFVTLSMNNSDYGGNITITELLCLRLPSIRRS